MTSSTFCSRSRYSDLTYALFHVHVYVLSLGARAKDLRTHASLIFSTNFVLLCPLPKPACGDQNLALLCVAAGRLVWPVGTRACGSLVHCMGLCWNPVSAVSGVSARTEH